MLLSRRRLVFAESQMYFQCGTMHRLETVATSTIYQSPNQELPEKRTRLFENRLGTFPLAGIGSSRWELYDRLQEFFERRLSYNADNVKAFIGIFNAFQGLEPGHLRATHFFGVPIFCDSEALTISTPSMAIGLTWRVRGDQAWKPPSKPDQDFPSWTWASIKSYRPAGQAGRLTFESNREGDMTSFQQGINIEFLHRVQGHVDVESYVRHELDYEDFHAEIHITSWTAETSFPTMSRYRNGRVSSLMDLPDGTIHLDYPGRKPRNKVMAIYLGISDTRLRLQAILLLVEQVKDETYRRVGLYHCPSASAIIGDSVTVLLESIRPRHGWQKRTIRVI